MLHMSDARLIGLHAVFTQTEVSVVCDGELKYTVSYLSLPVHGTEFL